MSREQLRAAVGVLALMGFFGGVALTAWLIHVEADVGAVAAVATLVGSAGNMAANVVRNLFPGSETGRNAT